MNIYDLDFLYSEQRKPLLRTGTNIKSDPIRQEPVLTSQEGSFNLQRSWLTSVISHSVWGQEPGSSLAGCFWPWVFHKAAVKMPGRRCLEVWRRLGDLSWLANTPGNVALLVGGRAIFPCPMSLSKVLLECSHDMAAGLPWNEQVKRNPRRKPKNLLWPSLRHQIPSLPEYSVYAKWVINSSPYLMGKPKPYLLKGRVSKNIWIF